MEKSNKGRDDIVRNVDVSLSPKDGAFNELMRTSYDVSRIIEQTLRPYRLTILQFHALRILQYLEPEHISVLGLRQHLFDDQADTSRLIDKLVNLSYAERTPSKSDRRRMEIRITDKGRQTLDRIEQKYKDVIKEKLGLSDPDCEKLIELLYQFRTNA